MEKQIWKLIGANTFKPWIVRIIPSGNMLVIQKLYIKVNFPKINNANFNESK